MKIWQKYLGATAVLAMASVLGLGTAPASAVTLKLATDSGAEGSPSGDALDAWAKMIEDGTDGDVQVDVFYQNQLGSQAEVFDLLMAGDVDMMISWPATSYDKRISLVYTPYMVLNWKQAYDAYEPGGWLNEALGGIFSDMGLRFFGAWPEGFNGVATSDTYATTVQGAKESDLKVRTPPYFPMPQTMQALGYQTAAIDWSEVFTAVQTGVVDGDAANVIYWDYEYFRDVVDYWVHTKHNFVTGTIVMNNDSWGSLTEAQQKIVSDSALKVMKDGFANAKKLDEMYRQKAIDAGMEYVEPNEEDMKSLAKAAREKVWPQMAEEIGEDLVDKVRENAPKL